jgi:hypothetical protein
MANTSPIFIGTPRLTTVASAASAGRDGLSGNIYPLFVSNSTYGSRVESISAITGTTTSNAANAIRIYITEAGGTNPCLIREGLIVTTTPSATVLGGYVIFNFSGGLLLGTASSIYVGQSTYNSAVDKVHYSCMGGDFI